MNFTKCDRCSDYIENEEVIKIEGYELCIHCVKVCKNCGKDFYYGTEHFCYDCEECGLTW